MGVPWRVDQSQQIVPRCNAPFCPALEPNDVFCGSQDSRLDSHGMAAPAKTISRDIDLPCKLQLRDLRRV